MTTIHKDTVLMEGLRAYPTRRGVTIVDLGPEANPTDLTPEVLDSERVRLGCRLDATTGQWIESWKFRREYRRDYDAQAGQPAFDPAWLDVQQPRLRNPLYRMDLNESGQLVKRDQGRLWVFVESDAQPESLPSGIGRVERACGIGMDVGEGVQASDSTIQVLFADTREHAAEFACNKIHPGQLGRFAVAVGQLYNNALICCVRKMHGLTVLRTMADELLYPYLWHSKLADRVVERNTARLGWGRGEMSDEYLVGPLQDAMEHDRLILHGARTHTQLGRWIYNESGEIVHQSVADLPREERARHGDLVVALALAWRSCCDLPAFRAMHKERRSPIVETMERQQVQEKGRVWRRPNRN